MNPAKILTLLGLLFPIFAQTQPYAVPWSKIAGGGATTSSTGGVYAVRGTLGQPDVGGSLTNAQHTFTGGFWALPIAVQTAGAPLLTIVQSGPGQARVSWIPTTPGFVLQETTSLDKPNWSNSPSGATTPVIVPAAGHHKFYRLRKP